MVLTETYVSRNRAMTKLTLSMDKKVVAQAKRIAKRDRTSVSAMFTNLVLAMAGRERQRADIPPDSIAARLTGAIKVPPGRTDRELVTEALEERYGAEDR